MNRAIAVSLLLLGASRAGAEPSATCRLAPVTERSARGCRGIYYLEFNVRGASAEAVTTAEILALDKTGLMLQSHPAEYGDVAQMTSSVHPADDRRYRTVSDDARHKIAAPVPLFRVEVRDGARVARAYCSNIPYLGPVEKDRKGEEAVRDPEEPVEVELAMPLVDPSTLRLSIDGIDVVKALGLEAAKHFPGGPYEGDVRNAAGERVLSVVELMVNASKDQDGGSANVFTLVVSNLRGAGATVPLLEVSGDRLAASPTPNRSCYVHELKVQLPLN